MGIFAKKCLRSFEDLRWLLVVADELLETIEVFIFPALRSALRGKSIPILTERSPITVITSTVISAVVVVTAAIKPASAVVIVSSAISSKTTASVVVVTAAIGPKTTASVVVVSSAVSSKTTSAVIVVTSAVSAKTTASVIVVSTAIATKPASAIVVVSTAATAVKATASSRKATASVAVETTWAGHKASAIVTPSIGLVLALGTSLFDDNATSVDIRIVEGVYGFIAFFINGHFYKPETTGIASFMIKNDFGRVYCPILFKQSPEIFPGCFGAEFSYKNVHGKK